MDEVCLYSTATIDKHSRLPLGTYFVFHNMQLQLEYHHVSKNRGKKKKRPQFAPV